MRIVLMTDRPGVAPHLGRWIRRLGHDVELLAGPPETLAGLAPGEVDCLVAAISVPRLYDLEDLSNLLAQNGWPSVLCLPALRVELIRRLEPLAFSSVLVEPIHRSQLRAGLTFAPLRAYRIQALERALSEAEALGKSRRLVERAKGFIMARHGVSEEAAHRLLQSQSQRENRRLEELALEVLETGGQ